MKPKKPKVFLEIDEEYVRMVAESGLERRLTPEEVENVEREIGEKLWGHISDAIWQIISHPEEISTEKDQL